MKLADVSPYEMEFLIRLSLDMFGMGTELEVLSTDGLADMRVHVEQELRCDKSAVKSALRALRRMRSAEMADDVDAMCRDANEARMREPRLAAHVLKLARDVERLRRGGGSTAGSGGEATGTGER